MLQLIVADLRHSAEKLTREDWLAHYTATLKVAGPRADEVYELKSILTGEDLGAEAARLLLAQPMEVAARRYPAMRLLSLGAPGDGADIQRVVPFYTQLLDYVSETEAASYVLTRYIDALDRRGAKSRADDVLDKYVKLFADADLGVTAALLRLGSYESGPARDRALIELIRHDSNALFVDRLRPQYVRALLVSGHNQEALREIDAGDALAGARGPADTAATMFRIVSNALDPINGDRFPNRTGKKTKSGATRRHRATTRSVCVGLTEQYLDRGDHATAVELGLAMFAGGEDTPLNLATGKPIDRPAQVIDVNDPKAAGSLARYLVATARVLDFEGRERQAMAALLASAPHDAVRPYILYRLGREAARVHDHETAMDHIDKALRLVPESPLLLELKQRVDRKQGQARRFSEGAGARRLVLHAGALQAAGQTQEAADRYREALTRAGEHRGVAEVARLGLIRVLLQDRPFEPQAVQRHVDALTAGRDRLPARVWNATCQLLLRCAVEAGADQRRDIWKKGLTKLARWSDEVTIDRDTLLELDRIAQDPDGRLGKWRLEVLTDMLLLAPDIDSMRPLQWRRIAALTKAGDGAVAVAAARLDVMLALASDEGPRAAAARCLEVAESCGWAPAQREELEKSCCG